MRALLALGETESRYGEASFYEPEPGVAAALSVGSDPASPSLRHKGDRRFPNEDGLLVLAEGERLLLAVADGHHGRAASHSLLEGLRDGVLALPTSLGELALALVGLPEWRGPGGTTLLVCLLDRAQGQGFGLNWGDCSPVHLGAEGAKRLTHRQTPFLQGGQPLEPSSGEAFRFGLAAGESLLLHSDGVNECHYRNPATSVTLSDLEELYRRHPGPRELVRSVLSAALLGVRGQPGGQDNVALIGVSF